jgi:hypothetical protein
LLYRDGRKLQAGTAILTEDGETVAVARATWVLTGVNQRNETRRFLARHPASAGWRRRTSPVMMAP